MKGIVVHEDSKEPILDYTIKVVQDRLDSNSTDFTKSKFAVWAPANRRSKIYFIKKGYQIKHIYVDASAIPSIAYKKKQEIDLVIEMIELGKAKFDYSKPMLIAKYRARDNSFFTEKTIGEGVKTKIHKNYTAPFPAPVDTYKAVKPTGNNLGLTEKYNKHKAKSSGLSRAIQGVLFADMNYCLFNERTNLANTYLEDLKEIDMEVWGNIKAFDSPEYGRIIMRTINREQSIDTLFALGVYVETSRLIFQNFTSDSKVLVHLKVLKKVLNLYSGTNLAEDALIFLNEIKKMLPKISIVEDDYKHSLRDKMNFEMNEDPIFIEIMEMNEALYQSLIE